MNGEERLQRIIDAHREVLTHGALALAEEKEWSLSTPVVLITPTEAKVIPCGSIGSALSVDTSVANPLIVEWLQLAKQTSPERALETMLNQSDEDRAEEFAAVYDAWRSDRKQRGAGDICRAPAIQRRGRSDGEPHGMRLRREPPQINLIELGFT